MPSSASREDLGFGSAADQRVFNLQVADRMDRVGAANRVRSHLRQADRANVAGLHEVRDRADGVLDGDGRIEPAGPIDVDVIDAETGQGVAEEVLHRRRPRVDAEPAAVGAAQRAELDRQQRLVAPVPQRPADEQLVVSGAVVVAGIEQRDAASRAAWIVAMFSPSSAGRTSPTSPCSRGPAETPPVPPHPAFASRPPWGQISIFYIPPAGIQNQNLTPPRVARL